ncbi:hypothetical protein [Microbacterium gorillae]|uniref:hypothetical protein n=1 Tax=Microbacterium gorillae TaxID=1231063 RepID=UPI003D96B81A
MSEQWTRTSTSLPAEGVVVDTIGPAGVAQPLKRMGSLWFFADGSMYVYYTPAYWRQRQHD